MGYHCPNKTLVCRNICPPILTSEFNFVIGSPFKPRISMSRQSSSVQCLAKGKQILSVGASDKISAEMGVEQKLFAGFDFGTSGARVIVVDSGGRIRTDSKLAYDDGASSNWAIAWKQTLSKLLYSIPEEQRSRILATSLDGTSSTTMIISRDTLESVTPPMLYNESRVEALPFVNSIAPSNHTVTTGTSTLCKLVAWWERQDDKTKVLENFQMIHQADWLLALLHGSEPITDYNNALKVGYDPEDEAYPDWLICQPFAHMLPKVVSPGSAIAAVSSQVSAQYGLPKNCMVYTGTTDSIAAFLAAKASHHGQAVTSLGSTMAVKLLSSARVDNAKFGVYSHRLGDSWLVGGASNTGGAVLRKLFTDIELHELSKQIDPKVASPLNYYPLPAVGERFPTADPHMKPRLDPRPETDVEYLHGLLESIARIEAQAYHVLKELGASQLTEVITAGGGAANPVWTAIRERILGVPVMPSEHTDAAYGVAMLACQSLLRDLDND